MTAGTVQPRTAWVQGAGRGVGLAVAERLAHEGVALLLTGRTPIFSDAIDRLQELGSPEVLTAIVDVADEAAVQRAVGQAAAAWGRLDALANLAGPPVVRRPIDQIPDEAWRAAFEVGALGALRVVRAALPLLHAAGTARVVNVSALSARLTTRGIAEYSAAKAALNSISKSLSIELAPRVLVNVVSPGPVLGVRLESELAARGAPVDDAAAALAILTERHDVRADLAKVAAPAEVADAVCFLLAPTTTHLTGINLPVDGGSVLPL